MLKRDPRFVVGSLVLIIIILVTGCSYLTDQKYELDLQVKDKQGEIKLSPLGGEYKPGTMVTVRAVPAEDYLFRSWGGDLSGREQQQTIKVTDNLTIRAQFDGKPIFKKLSDQQIIVDNKLSFQVQPQDPEGKPVSLKVRNKPQGANFAHQTGEFSWVPASADLGTHRVTFLASDGKLTKRKTITIKVKKPNQPPKFKQLDDQEIIETKKLSFSVEATDPEGKQVKLSIENKPKTAVFNSQTGKFSWLPDHKAAGDYKVTFVASDGREKTEKSINIKVKNKNQAPVLRQIGNKQIKKNKKLTFKVQASDPDQESVKLKIKNRPVGANFNSETGKFNWQPDYNSAGNYEVTFIATDGELRMQETITISVGTVNTPPEAKKDTGITTAGKQVKLDLLANDSDPDSERLVITKVSDGTYGQVVNNQDGTVTYQPQADYTGQDSFNYVISDKQGATDQGKVTVKITQPTDSPRANADIATVQENSSVIINLLANDSNPGQPPLTITHLGTAEHGQVKQDSKGQVIYTPQKDYQGQDSFTYTISNGQGKTDTARTTIIVKPTLDSTQNDQQTSDKSATDGIKDNNQSSSSEKKVDLNSNAQLELVAVQGGITSAGNGSLKITYDLYVGKYEITNQQFVRFLNQAAVDPTGRYKGKRIINLEGANCKLKYTASQFQVIKPEHNVSQTKANVNFKRHPVIQVTWYGAVAYCNWLSSQAGLAPAYDLNDWSLQDNPQQLEGYRLPTAKEWEYAARGGTKGLPTAYAGSNQAKEVAWYQSATASEQNKKTSQATRPVGQKRANELGLYDLSGNVGEWTTTQTGSFVLRCGGSWNDQAAACRVTSTDQIPPASAFNELGFRVVRTKQ